jgi:transmembrane sensor
LEGVRSGEQDDVESLAAAWAVRSAERELDAGEQRELEAWLDSDTRHLGAYVRAQAIWLDTDRVAALDSGSRAEPTPYRRPLPWRPFAAAASIALALGSSYIAYDQLSGRTASAPGEIRRIALDDGSTMFLNADSVVQIRYGASQRRVVLRQGEALFQVQHDAARPFVVEADDVSVRAVGTEFSVKVDPAQGVAVTVADGQVALSGGGAARVPGGTYLKRNEQFFASPLGARRASIDAAEVDRRLAWRDGMLVFNGQRLAVAVAEVNRYAAVPIEINDPTLGRAEFVGTFKVGDSQTFARAAATAFDGEVRRVGDRLILMRRQDSPSH